MTDSVVSSRNESTSLLSRHYTTIGIHDVFLEPPPASLLPQSYLTSSCADTSFPTWEIVGTIKSSPEDFVVHEIASRKRTPKLPKNFDVVADLSSVSTGVDHHSSTPQEARKQEHDDEKQAVVETNDIEEMVKPSAVQAEKSSDEMSSSPAEIVERILSDAFGSEEASEVLQQIRLLQERANVSIKEYPNTPTDEKKDILWIPPMSSTDSSSRDNGNNTSRRGGHRGLLHRNIKLAFPLLKSETVMYENKERSPQANVSVGTENAIASEATKAAATAKHAWIRVSIDDTFFGLAPSLYRPEEDIPKLYCFRNRGCVVVSEQQGRDDKSQGKKRKREKQDTNGDNVVCLRLRPDLTREERRPVHHLISNAFRDFETSTIPNHGTTEDGTQNVAAVVVTWSKRAQQRARKKNGGSSSKAARPTMNTLCVMKKTQKEHLTVIRRLVQAIRCRQSDIGLAGIKDMHAVTYQFCTIANISPEHVKRANSSLQGIELGRMQQVDWVLNSGDLQGNRFEIMIRNVKRIHVESKNGNPSEVRVPCEREHLLAMVKRIRNNGFVNFYGEQRLGMPGRSSEVGVRSFDVGRALLQQDFSKAIDLLMAGRIVCYGEEDTESPEIRHARQVWKETNGDVNQTLKAMPKGDAMARERTVLQGLKRYGTEDPLAALKCIHFGVHIFWINAYQSYVWNIMASERLKRFGTTVIKGDLYFLPDDEGTRNDVRVVTDDPSTVDIASVVLPLPGYAIQYPENEIGSICRDFLTKENVSFVRNAPSETTAKGSYRSLIAFAQTLEVSFDPKKSSKQDTVSEFKLRFDLPSGSYATMLMRELMLTTVAR